MYARRIPSAGALPLTIIRWYAPRPASQSPSPFLVTAPAHASGATAATTSPISTDDARAAEPRIRLTNPSGAFYLFPDVSEFLSPDGIRTSSELATALLNEARVPARSRPLVLLRVSVDEKERQLEGFSEADELELGGG